MKEFYFPVRKNTRIHCCQWIPDGRPRGIIQIVHGIAEYAARYDELAKVFTAHGFVVAAEDHMGHGGSISEEIPQGCFADGWLTAVSDTYRLMQMTKEEYPDLPYILYGHSMGSFRPGPCSTPTPTRDWPQPSSAAPAGCPRPC